MADQTDPWAAYAVQLKNQEDIGAYIQEELNHGAPTTMRQKKLDRLDDENSLLKPYVIANDWSGQTVFKLPSAQDIKRINKDLKAVEKRVNNNAAAKTSLQVATLVLGTLATLKQ